MISLQALLAVIAALESRRAVLGDAAVDAAVPVLRAQVARLGATESATENAPSVPSNNPPNNTSHTAPRIASPLAPRLRQVSVLFVDVADSTALLQHATPEDAQQLIGVALERFAAVVQAAGGVVLLAGGGRSARA